MIVMIKMIYMMISQICNGHENLRCTSDIQDAAGQRSCVTSMHSATVAGSRMSLSYKAHKVDTDEQVLPDFLQKASRLVAALNHVLHAPSSMLHCVLILVPDHNMYQAFQIVRQGTFTCELLPSLLLMS